MTFQALRVYNTLKRLSECTETEHHNVQWGQVYIENITVAGLNDHQVAGYLSTLTERGLYRSIDGVFGLVRL